MHSGFVEFQFKELADKKTTRPFVFASPCTYLVSNIILPSHITGPLVQLYDRRISQSKALRKCANDYFFNGHNKRMLIRERKTHYEY